MSNLDIGRNAIDREQSILKELYNSENKILTMRLLCTLFRSRWAPVKTFIAVTDLLDEEFIIQLPARMYKESDFYTTQYKLTKKGKKYIGDLLEAGIIC